MKRLVVIISTFLILSGMYGGSVGAKDHNTSVSTSGSASTASSSSSTESWKSEIVWCVTKHGVVDAALSACRKEGLPYYFSEWKAIVEYARLYGRSSKGYSSTDSGSKSVWCATKESAALVENEEVCSKFGGTIFSSQAQAQSAVLGLKLAWNASKLWCATRQTVYLTTNASCVDAGGKSYSNKYLAEEERKRLKGSTSFFSHSTVLMSGEVWCVTKFAVSRTSIYSCNLYRGKAFETEFQAKAEYKRLKGSSSSSTSVASDSSSKLVWCVTNKWWKYTKETTCGAAGGEIYPSEYLAKAEYYRLKLISSGSSGTLVWCGKSFKKSCVEDDTTTSSLVKRLDSSGSTSTAGVAYCYDPLRRKFYRSSDGICFSSDERISKQQYADKRLDSSGSTSTASSVVDNTVEMEFWNSIKGSDDPEEYQIYLDEYPTGKFVKLAKLRIKKLGGTATSVAQSSIPDLNYGDYYALVIGNNRYEHLPELRTAINDAQSVANVLEIDYGFEVTVLENADRSQILKAISVLRSKVGDQDNVLIYYAGHGSLDEAADEGFWLPTDASPEDPSNWIATDRIVGQVRAMQAKHVMVVADSCFSGSITRGFKIEQRAPDWLETIVNKKSRTVLTSGGLEPVLDSGGGRKLSFR